MYFLICVYVFCMFCVCFYVSVNIQKTLKHIKIIKHTRKTSKISKSSKQTKRKAVDFLLFLGCSIYTHIYIYIYIYKHCFLFDAFEIDFSQFSWYHRL